MTIDGSKVTRRPRPRFPGLRREAWSLGPRPCRGRPTRRSSARPCRTPCIRYGPSSDRRSAPRGTPGARLSCSRARTRRTAPGHTTGTRSRAANPAARSRPGGWWTASSSSVVSGPPDHAAVLAALELEAVRRGDRLERRTQLVGQPGEVPDHVPQLGADLVPHLRIVTVTDQLLDL